ncbi:histidine phosphatase family protein [Parageobacillus thermoglucosidasius]|uniref:histidine phosphatase family protein n=1 Tax=Parageobacillus thermoglucosidasius TaxID=1426 RepID=UPI002E22FB7B|nr:histidine phosphatase family protein [Parageobacillus thermoglucosidasius]MED4914462.1 histidine phosphatase family protein [Parageobacillus thermoglucosidasius]MED4946889.1 histidine phosphatase family protein [Parageobacillus thermoglucosidasius]MED4983042.1 histidine phosphatase family protein [Parageobacillus thermoglucosidasius]
MADSLAITLIRHGMTPENQARRYIGHTDVPLAEQEKTRLLQADLPLFKPVDLLVSSDLLRCKQTRELLFRNYGGGKYEMVQWREMHFGDWEGKTFLELKEIKEYRQWLSSPLAVAPPNGESYQAFCQRVEEALEQTVLLAEQANAEHVAVVTHGGPIRCILERYAPQERPFWEWTVPFGGGFTLQSTLERWKEKKRCISLSEVLFKESENGRALTTELKNGKMLFGVTDMSGNMASRM